MAPSPGSGRGIGAAIALKLASDGAAVVVHDLDEASAKETVAAIEAVGGRPSPGSAALSGSASRSGSCRPRCGPSSGGTSSSTTSATPGTPPLVAGLLRARRRYQSRHALTESTAARLGELTEREVRVLELVALGRTNPAIAHALDVSPRTIAKHLEHIYRKLNVTNRAAAATLAASS